MRLEFAIFCEAAQVLPDGLINMLRGGYDIIFTPTFPAVTNRMVAIVRFWCDEDEVDRPHSLVPQIVDPTGHILPLDMTLQFTPPSHPFKPERGNRHTIKVEYPDVSFSEQGDYTFRFLVDGVSMGEYTVDVRKADGVEQP